MQYVPLVVLGVVLVLIAVRQVGDLRLRIWQVMLAGALAVLLFGQIGPLDALRAINADVMVFLFCMFIIGQALERSGLLARLAHGLFRNAKSVDALVLTVLFGMGIASAILMNDTLAIVGTPVVILLARKHHVRPAVLLLALAFAITIGSVMSPIGNPQNLLIAVEGGVADPFVTFARYLAIPTLINLLLAYLVLRVIYREEFHGRTLVHKAGPIRDERLARLAGVSLILMLALIALKVGLALVRSPFDLPMTAIAVAAAAPILLFSPRRVEVVRRIDWSTLVFFAAMFVLMASVWRSGAVQALLGDARVAGTGVILGVGVLASQLVSNVPLVALYLPALVQAGTGVVGLMALAAGSTIAGNLLLLGAASNVIIVQNAEERGETITFWEFARVGIPLTILNVAVYWAFLSLW